MCEGREKKKQTFTQTSRSQVTVRCQGVSETLRLGQISGHGVSEKHRSGVVYYEEIK
jgi:hypothetical protein